MRYVVPQELIFTNCNVDDTNKAFMIDEKIGTQTANIEIITFEIEAILIDTIALFNVDAQEVYLKLKSAKRLPTVLNGTLFVEIRNPSQVANIGNLIIGNSKYLGVIIVKAFSVRYS